VFPSNRPLKGVDREGLLHTTEETRKRGERGPLGERGEKENWGKDFYALILYNKREKEDRLTQ